MAEQKKQNYEPRRDLAIVRQENIGSVQKLFRDHKDQIMMALPKHMDADRMLRIALTELRSNPKLQECDPLSFFASIIKSSQLGLEIGLVGEAYLIPRKIKGRMEVTFQPGFRGLRKLAKNAGDVLNISAHVVYSNDHYEVDLGSDERIVHRPLLTGPRGEKLFAYGIIKYRDGSYEIELMTREDIEHIRDTRSENWKNYQKNPTWDDGNPKDPPAWITDESEMWKKTVIIRACKRVTLSPELQQALALDMAAESGDPQRIKADIFGEETIEGNPIESFWYAMATHGMATDDKDMTAYLEEMADAMLLDVEAVMARAVEEGDKKPDAWKRFMAGYKKWAKKAKQEDAPPPETPAPPALHDQKCPVGGKLAGDYPAVEFCDACEQRPGCPSWA